MEEEVKTPEIDPETQPIAFTQKTRAERLREAASAPDFSIPDIRPAEDFFSESVMQLDDQQLKDMMRETGVTASVGEQTAVAIGNSLRSMNQLGDEFKISYGNLMNYFTGNSIGDDISKIAYESIAQNQAEMANRVDAIGGITDFWAQLAGGATSFTQLALEGIVTAGALPLAHIGIQSFGEGAFNDMKAYADEHDGSLKGYKPNGFDLAANAANALLQVVIENKLGVGSPRFLVGASRGGWTEGLSGALQEGVQGALTDLTEAVKGNEDISILLDNAENYLQDAIVGGILQGSLGAVTHHQNYARAVDTTAQAIAKTHGHETPTAKEKEQSKAIIDAKERQEASLLTQEFKSAFDASTGEGQLQRKIATELKRAVESKELDLDTASETELAQRIEQISTQETLNAIDFAREQNRAISDMELNNIVYKDGAIWLEGLTPEVGDKAVSYARVLAERQSGLAELNTRIDANKREIQQLKADLAEAQAQKQESRTQVLQARIDKQNSIAEKNRMQAQKLEAQTAKLEKQIAKQAEQVKVAEPVKTEEVSAEVKPIEAPKREVLAQVKKKEPVVEKKSLKQERIEKKKTKTEKETEAKLADVYNRIMTQARQIAEKQFSEISQEEKEQANKTTKPEGNIWFNKHAGDVYIAIMPQIDDITKSYEVKYRTYARNTDTDKISSIYGKTIGEFENGSTGFGQREQAKNKEELERIVNKMINDFGEKYAFFDMQFTDDSLKYLAEGHQQEEPEALKYKNQELRDLEQQGFEEQYKIKTGKDWKKVNQAKYNVKTELLSRATSVSRDSLEDTLKNSQYGDVILLKEGENVATWRYVLGGWAVSNNIGMKAADAQIFNSDSFYEWIKKEPIAKFPQIETLYVKNEVAEPIFNNAIENGILFQGSISGKGDTNRGGYDDQLKRIILDEKSDLSTIQHEFAHYWMQNNFKWARSGLASQDWLRKWRDVEEWLGIEPQDRLLSKTASEKFAKAYERYILEGKVAPELQWAFEGFQKVYQDIYEDLENEYFDLDEELAPEVIDWFNRNKEQSPKRLLQADEKKLEKSLTLAAGGSVIEQAPENTIVMTETNEKGEPVVTMAVKQSEIPAGDNLLVQADKTTASKLQQSAKRWLSDKVEVQQLTTLDTQATLKNFKDWIARDRQGAWNAMMNADTRPIYRTYLYKAFSEQAMNDVNLAMELANMDMAQSVRELGQALQALNITKESGFDMIEIIRNLEKSKGEVSEEELNNSIAESGVFDVELSDEEMNEINSETECKL